MRSKGDHVADAPDSSISLLGAGSADWVSTHLARSTEIDPDSSFSDLSILRSPQTGGLGNSGNATMSAFSFLPVGFLSFRNGTCAVAVGVPENEAEREDLHRDTPEDRDLLLNRAGALTASLLIRFMTVWILGILLSAAGSANIALQTLLVSCR